MKKKKKKDDDQSEQSTDADKENQEVQTANLLGDDADEDVIF